MSWLITQKPAYVSDFIDLSRELQGQIVGALRELEVDPLDLRGDTIKKLQGYTNLYRYRIGGFRLIYAAEPQARMLNLLAVGPRASIYRRFNFDGWDAPEAAVEFGSELAPQPEWSRRQEESSEQTKKFNGSSSSCTVCLLTQ